MAGETGISTSRVYNTVTSQPTTAGATGMQGMNVSRTTPRATATIPFSATPVTFTAGPPLVTTAAGAPAPAAWNVPVTAGTWRGVPALRQTAGQPIPGQPGYEEAPEDTARYGAYARALETPGVYGQAVAGEYGAPQTGPLEVGEMIGTVGGRSQWDIQREQIQTQFDAEQQRQLESLDAALAQQGVRGGAAIAARNDLIRQMEQQRSTAMSEVNAAEASYLGQAAQTLAAQRYGTTERLGEQAFTADMTYAGLNQRERELAENGRQYDNKYDFDVWATEQGYTNEERTRAWQAMQNDEDRRLTAADLQSKIDNMRNSLQFDYDQLATSTGVEREKIQYNIWAKEQDIASSERMLAYRSYADQQLATLNSDLEQGRWINQQEVTQRQTSYFNMGKSGLELSAEQLETLELQDPLAYYAYQDGRSNLSLVMFDANMDLRTNYLEAAIAGLSELTGDAFTAALGSVYTDFNRMFGPSGQFGGESLGYALPYQLMPGEPTGGETGGETGGVFNPTPGNEYANIPGTGTFRYTTGGVSQGSYQPSVQGGATGSGQLWRGRGVGDYNNQMGGIQTINVITPPNIYGSEAANSFILNPDGRLESNYLYDERTLIEAVTSQAQAGAWSVPVSYNTGTERTNNVNNSIYWTRSGIAAGTIKPESFPVIDTSYLDAMMSNGDRMTSYVANIVNIGGKAYITSSPVDRNGNVIWNGLMAVDVDNPSHAIVWIPGDARYEINDYGRTGGTAGGGTGSLSNLLGNSSTSYTAQQYRFDTSNTGG